MRKPQRDVEDRIEFEGCEYVRGVDREYVVYTGELPDGSTTDVWVRSDCDNGQPEGFFPPGAASLRTAGVVRVVVYDYDREDPQFPDDYYSPPVVLSGARLGS